MAVTFWCLEKPSLLSCAGSDIFRKTSWLIMIDAEFGFNICAVSAVIKALTMTAMDQRERPTSSLANYGASCGH